MVLQQHYLIRGGLEGHERLRIVGRIMQPTTISLLRRAGVELGMVCLDAGCGGGDVTFELARLVGPTGRVVGIDIDATKLDLAGREAEERRLGNVTFKLADIARSVGEAEFDVVYARFLLTHLKDPAGALARMLRLLRPGGRLIVEDIDYSGSLCYPESAAYRRYVELYTQAALRRGGDPHIGPRLPGMLLDAGAEQVMMYVVQPAGSESYVKLISPVTLENVRHVILAEDLASVDELDRLLDELYELVYDERTVASIPRVVQAWGYRPNNL